MFFESVLMVIFDCDGVLVDSEQIVQDIDLVMIAELGWPITRDEIFDEHLGRSEQAFARNIERHTGKSLPAGFLQERRARYLHAFETELKPVAGIEAAVKQLQATSTATCIASSGSHERMDLTLGVTGLRRYFVGRIFSGDEVERGKPAPDLFLHAARSMTYEPADCVVVEDSPSGVAAARSAGMRVVAYAGLTPARFLQEAETVIADMDELVDTIERLRVAS